MENTVTASEINKLATAIIERLAPRIPLDVALWDISTIGEYMRMSSSQVTQRIVCQPSFPKSIWVPVARGRSEKSRAQPRWKAKEVIDWAERFKC